jgi:hypothetical protein
MSYSDVQGDLEIKAQFYDLYPRLGSLLIYRSYVLQLVFSTFQQVWAHVGPSK